jgi:hypothetical protein
MDISHVCYTKLLEMFVYFELKLFILSILIFVLASEKFFSHYSDKKVIRQILSL